jgi:hypothetical protein
MLLVDILCSLSKRKYRIHGFYAIPGAVIYLNPTSHFHSISIDDLEGVTSPKELQRRRKEERQSLVY